MFDPLDEDRAPRQAPTLTEPEEARAYGELAEEHILEWMMGPEDGADMGTMLEQLLHRPSWHALANCRGLGCDAFFLERGRQYEDWVRELCGSCTVRDECRETAMADSELQGLWANTTPVDRKLMRQQRAPGDTPGRRASRMSVRTRVARPA